MSKYTTNHPRRSDIIANFTYTLQRLRIVESNYSSRLLEYMLIHYWAYLQGKEHE